MTLAVIIDENLDVIEVHIDKNIKFFTRFFNIALEVGKSIGKTKRYKLVLKIAMLYLKSFILLTFLLNFYLIICICQI